MTLGITTLPGGLPYPKIKTQNKFRWTVCGHQGIPVSITTPDINHPPTQTLILRHVKCVGSKAPKPVTTCHFQGTPPTFIPSQIHFPYSIKTTALRRQDTASLLDLRKAKLPTQQKYQYPCMAANTSGMCLLGAIDSLWFHQIVLFSQQSLFPHPPESPEAVPLSPSESSDTLSRNSSDVSVISQKEISSVASDETSSQESDQYPQEIKISSRHKEKPKKLYLPSNKTRWHSSSPVSAKNQPRKLRHSGYSSTWPPQKTRSCKRLIELELDEVKGFMDLGFTFNSEYFNSRLIKLVPGLQRIDAHQIEHRNSPDSIKFRNNTHDFEEEGEAWVRNRFNSPLAKSVTPKSIAAAAHMKKHLKDWARTVALIVQLEE